MQMNFFVLLAEPTSTVSPEGSAAMEHFGGAPHYTPSGVEPSQRHHVEEDGPALNTTSRMSRAGEWNRVRAGSVCTWATVQACQANTPGMGLLFLTSCFLLLCLLPALKRPVQLVFVKSGLKQMYPLPLFSKYD